MSVQQRQRWKHFVSEIMLCIIHLSFFRINVQLVAAAPPIRRKPCWLFSWVGAAAEIPCRTSPTICRGSLGPGMNNHDRKQITEFSDEGNLLACSAQCIIAPSGTSLPLSGMRLIVLSVADGWAL
ncbi:hypothetical protein BJ166DRAFT_111692 [Pestalotiopsis sp. NC0098]|nr:hypothetical protein BJ166DRAFT_111692 [Pestalotiopsis sp. NC0098]